MRLKTTQPATNSNRWLAGWSMDLKLGLRMLQKSPGLTAIALVALAVGIGAGAAFFEFSNDFVRARLPFEGGDRFVGIVTFDTRTAGLESRTTYEFSQWRRQLKTIDHVGAVQLIEPNVTTADGRTAPVDGAAVSASIFQAIPTAPLHGRPLSADDERAGANEVVVLGHETWRDVFGSDPGVVGTTVRLNNVVHEVVGVMPQGFGFPINQSLWTPLRVDTANLGRESGPAIKVFGKLAKGVTLEAAQAELDALANGAPDAASYAHLKPTVYPYIQSVWADPSEGNDVQFLYSLNLLFLGLIGICGANIATLVFARTTTRENEITVRTALGASRLRIVSQMVAEALVLTGIAAVIALVGASAVLRLVQDVWTTAQGPLPFWWDASLETETILYAAIVTLCCALLVGAVPALKATTKNMQGRLKTAGATGGTRSFGRLWTSVIIGQAAFTVMFLIIVAGLVWATTAIYRQEAGLAVPGGEYLTARIEAPGKEPGRRAHALVEELQRRMVSEPGVRNVTYASSLPGLGGGAFYLEFADPAVAASAPASEDEEGLWVRSARVAANYFDTFSQRIVAGRAFSEGDIAQGREVAVVDQSFVRLVLRGRSAVGLMVRPRAFQEGQAPGPWHEIIGVVTDIVPNPSKPVQQAVLYRPLDARYGSQRYVIVQAGAEAARTGSALRRAAFAIDPEARLEDVQTLDQAADSDLSALAYLVSGYATVGSVALLLATAGIYALVSFTLSVRTREIGIRVALGAAPGRMLTGVLSRALRQVGAGVILGSILGIAFLSRGILDTSDNKLSSYTEIMVVVAVGVSALVLLVAALSCWVPIGRALRTDPTQALRAE
jgi:putative ABC transport system permease protein